MAVRMMMTNDLAWFWWWCCRCRATAVFWSMSFHSIPSSGYCGTVNGKLGQHKSIPRGSVFQENQIPYGTGISNKTFKRKNIWFNDNITTTKTTAYTHRLCCSLCATVNQNITTSFYPLYCNQQTIPIHIYSDWSCNRCNKIMVILLFLLILTVDHSRQRKLCQFVTRPLYSCVLCCLAFELKWGWSWPCFDRNLTAFLM